MALHLEEFSARRELDRKATQLGFLHRMIQQIAAERHNEEMVRKVVDVLVAELGFPRVEFYTPVPGDSEGFALLAGRSLPHGAEEVPAGCEPEIVAAMRTGTRIEREDTPSALDGGVGEDGRITVLALPIVFEGELFGVLGACGDGFSPAEIEVLEITAEHMTTFWALNNLLALRRHESLVDPLTQVWNRRYIMRRLDEESSRILRHQGHGAVVLVDLGDFKLINDRYGHVMGDEVLRVTSATMSGNLRNYDMIGRYGGDEFLLYLPDVARDEAEAIMSRMERKVSEQEIPGLNSSVVLDYGIAVCPEDGHELAEVIKIADERMYRNKARRKAGERI